MRQRIIYSYSVRLAFVICAIAAAVLIIHYRILVKKDDHLLRANSRKLT